MRRTARHHEPPPRRAPAVNLTDSRGQRCNAG